MTRAELEARLKELNDMHAKLLEQATMIKGAAVEIRRLLSTLGEE